MYVNYCRCDYKDGDNPACPIHAVKNPYDNILICLKRSLALNEDLIDLIEPVADLTGNEAYTRNARLKIKEIRQLIENLEGSCPTKSAPTT